MFKMDKSFRDLLINLPKEDILDLVDNYNEYIKKVNNIVQEKDDELEIYNIENFYNLRG